MFHCSTIIKEELLELFYLHKTEQALLLTYSGTLLNLMCWLLFTRKLFLDIVSCFTNVNNFSIIKEELFYLHRTEQALLLIYSGTLLNLMCWLLFTRKLFLDIV